MDSAMGESAEGNLDASDSSIEEISTGSARLNGEVNGLGDDPLELSGEAKVSSLKSAFSGGMIDKASKSDDNSIIIGSKENGSVKVPNKDSVKMNISGTKVPTSVVDITEMEVDEVDSDADDKVSITEEKDPLELSDTHSNSITDKSHEENISDDLNSSSILDINGSVESENTNNILNDKNHKVNDKKVKENGGSDPIRSPDIEEISSDSMKFNKDLDSPDKNDEFDRDGDSRDGSMKSGETTPAKVKKSRKSLPPANLTPRRSSRNLSRAQKSYSEPKDEPEAAEPEEESDVEEIHPVDPLADLSSKPIIVKDTRKLVEIAAGARAMKGGAKKEPTLVIIDTNSILAGRGPVPMSQSQSQSHRLSSPLPSTSRSTQGYTILPVGLSSQGISYPKARITPYPPSYARVQPIPIHVPVPKPPPPQPQILPTLTDDMYVVEAPSFIVPYVYEKPPIKPLKDYLKKLSAEIARLTKLEEEEDKKEEEMKKEEEKKEEMKKEEEKQVEMKKEEEKKEVDSKKEEKEKQNMKEIVAKPKENDVNGEKEKEQDGEREVAEKVQLDKTSKESEDAAEVKNAEVKSVTEESEEAKEKNETESGKPDEEKIKSKSDDVSEKMLVDDDDVKIITESKSKDDANDKVKDKSSVQEPVVEDAKKDSSVSTDAASVDKDKTAEDKVKTPTYFDNPLGKFFMQIGTNLVTEFVQTDLLRHQRRRRDREGKISESAQYAVNALMSNLEISKENNKPFHLPIKKCEFCSFKTESALVMAQHLETPHMRNYIYRCNFCPLEVRGPHDILFHMEAEHNVRGRLERAPAFHQCPSCPFEDNQKGKLTRHILACSKKFKPEKNLEPPADWEPPAKIPRVSRNRPTSMGLGTAAYQAMIAKQGAQHPLLPKLLPTQPVPSPGGAIRGRGRPTMQGRFMPDMKITAQGQRPIIQATQMRPGMLYRPSVSGSHPQTLLPNTYQIAGNQLFQVVGSQGHMMPVGSASRLTLMPQGGPTPVALVPNIAAGSNSVTIQGTKKNTASKLPSISITPLPRQTTISSPQTNSRQQSPQSNSRQQSPQGGGAQGKTYVICEICDGYIKDLEQLRNHMLWIHKVKIHPKMIHNRPPLNCQKCQCRFFTDQGLERHLLGTHGLVTSSMQEAANRGKDAGRCPACGRVYQWKLLNHVARDHGMVLKPAHLSYKCTVCTATFGMYKQFENHVYSAHSTQAKRVMDKKPATSSQVYRPQPNEAPKSLLKPLKMSDEITIIPQPSTTPYPQIGPASKTGRPTASLLQSKLYKGINCEMCEDTFGGTAAYTRYVAHMRKCHLQTVVKICRIDKCPNCPKCKSKFFTDAMREYLVENKKRVDVIELSDDEVAMAGQGRNEITITKVSCSPGPRRFKHRLQQSRNVQVIDLDDTPKKNSEEAKENGEDSLTAVKERLRRRKSLEISQVDSEDPLSEPGPSKKRRRNND